MGRCIAGRTCLVDGYLAPVSCASPVGRAPAVPGTYACFLANVFFLYVFFVCDIVWHCNNVFFIAFPRYLHCDANGTQRGEIDVEGAYDFVMSILNDSVEACDGWRWQFSGLVATVFGETTFVASPERARA